MRKRLMVSALICLGVLLIAPHKRVQAQRSELLREEFHQTYQMSPTGRISVENIQGDVHIQVWDRNEVKLDAVKMAYTRERLSEVEIKVDATGDSLRVHTQYPSENLTFNDDEGLRYRNPATVEYTLTVPRTARLSSIELVNGNLEIDGVTGEVNGSSVNGHVTARNLRGEVKLATVNGLLEATFDRLDESKAVSLGSVNGDVVLVIPSDSNATIKAGTVSGNIRNDFGLPVRRGDYVGRDIYGQLGHGGARLKLGNVNGSITIRHASDGRSLSPATSFLSVGEGKGKGRGEGKGKGAGKGDEDNDEDYDWDSEQDSQREAQRAAREAQREAVRAQREAELAQREAVRAQQEAQRAAQRAQQEAIRAQQEAQRAVVEAQRQAQQDTQRSQQEAQRAQQEAQREAQRAQLEAQRAQQQAQRDAEQSQREATQTQREAQQQAVEAQRAAVEAQREAQRVAADAQREAAQAARQAQLEAAQAAREAQAEGARAAREAQQEAARAAREAVRAAQSDSTRSVTRVYSDGDYRLVERSTINLDVEGTPRINVETFDGTVTIRGWDKPNVTINLVKRASSEQGLRGIKFNADKHGNQININADFDKAFAQRIAPGITNINANASLEIFVPRNVILRAISGDGRLLLEGVGGEVDLRTGDGSIDVLDGRGRVLVKTGDGRIRIARFNGAADASTGDGRISLDGLFSQLAVRTGDGSITLAVPDGFNAIIESDAEDLISEGLTVTEQAAPSKRLRRWKIGQGGTVLSLRTGSGKIILQRAGEK